VGQALNLELELLARPGPGPPGRLGLRHDPIYAGSLVDLDAYRAEAEEFVTALDREYYLHFSGRQDAYDIEPIYERHAELFSREAVEGLREKGARLLLEFAVHGLIGQETKAEQAELARREAELELELDGRRIPFRSATVEQANEDDPDRRAAIEAARNDATEQHLNPLHRGLLERSHALAAELGWPSMRAMCEELADIDLVALGRQTAAFLEASEAAYRPTVEPRLREHLGFGFERLRRADLIAFFRAPSLDSYFPTGELVPSLEATLAGLGIDIAAQTGVHLDVERRPKKSPRAFCAPVRVPHEVYLVISPIGGRDDFAALMHEAGHTEHYAHVDPDLPLEERVFGDNSVTEGFAFLFDHLTADPEWLRRRLGHADAAEVVEHERAVKLLFLRRYCAKLAYELELHNAPRRLDPLREAYVQEQSRAVGVDWPGATWLSDVDPFFYVARYLRAWALETHLRRLLRERFGAAWFEQREAGQLLRGLWRRGQRHGATELLDELTGAPLDFSALEEAVVV
jgi:hypothetical protein